MDRGPIERQPARATTRSSRGVHEQPDVKQTGKFSGKITEKLTDSSENIFKLEGLKYQAKYGNIQEDSSLKQAKFEARTLQDKTQRGEVLKEMKDELTEKKKTYLDALKDYNDQNKLDMEHHEGSNILREGRGSDKKEFQKSEDLSELEVTMNNAKEAFEKADADLTEINKAIIQSDKAIENLQEAGTSVVAAIKLGEAVDAYRDSVRAMVAETDPQKKNAAKANVTEKATEVKAALQEASEGIKTNGIEQQIQECKTKEGKSTLKKLQLVLSKYELIDESTKSEKISEVFDRCTASIAKDGAASKVFEEIRETKKSNDEKKAIDRESSEIGGEFQKNLGALATVNQCISDLEAIETMLAVDKGLDEFQVKNNQLIDNCKELKKSWALSILTLFIGDLVVMIVQSYYENKGADADAVRKEANALINDLLGIPEDQHVEIIAEPDEDPDFEEIILTDTPESD